MVVPTYPEGGSHALQVCQQHHHQVALCESATVSDCQRDSKNTLLATAIRPIRLKPVHGII